MIPTLLTHLAATLYMTGVIWFVQIVHYPLFSALDRTDYTAHHHRHMTLTTWVVAPPMLVEMLTAPLLLWLLPNHRLLLWLNLFLLTIIWLSTWRLQVPRHNQLTAGFDAPTHRRLVMSNWLRTLAWSLRALLLLTLTARLIRHNP